MDPLTHGLLGAVTAQLGFRRVIGGRATLLAAGAAMLPDLDMLIAPLARLIGMDLAPLADMRLHRGLSHSLLMTPLIALAVALPWWLSRRKRAARQRELLKPIADKVTHPEVKAIPPPPAPREAPFVLLYACIFVAALSHPLLDACTSYGTQLLAPLTDRRFAWNAVGVIDFIYTPILILTLIICRRLRKRENNPTSRAATTAGRMGFLLGAVYIAAGFVMHSLAVGQVRQLAGAADAPPGSGKILSANAYPCIGTILAWRATVETEHYWLAGHLCPLKKLDPSAVTHTWAKKVRHVLINRVENFPTIKTFRWFSAGQLRAQIEHRRRWTTVVFHDMRYGLNPGSVESIWSVRVTFDSNGKLISIKRTRNISITSWRQGLNWLWDQMRGFNPRNAAAG